MFTRLGLQFAENATQAQKLAQVLDFLKRGAGQLEIAGKGITGEWRGVKMAFGELLESLGGVIGRTGVLQVVFSGIAKAINWMGEAIGATVPRIEGLRNAVSATITKIEDATEAENKQKTALEGVAKAAKEAEDALAKKREEIERSKTEEEQADEAFKRRDLARINLLEKTKRITPMEAEYRRADVGVFYAERTFKREQLARAQAASAETGAVKGMEAEIAAKETEAAELKKKSDAAKKLEADQANVARLEKDLANAQADEKAAAEKVRQAVSAGFSAAGLPPPAAVPLPKSERVKALEEELRAARLWEGGRPEWMAPGVTSASLSSQATQAEAEAKAAREKYGPQITAGRNRIGILTGQLGAAAGVYRTDKDTAALGRGAIAGDQATQQEVNRLLITTTENYRAWSKTVLDIARAQNEVAFKNAKEAEGIRNAITSMRQAIGWMQNWITFGRNQ